MKALIKCLIIAVLSIGYSVAGVNDETSQLANEYVTFKKEILALCQEQGTGLLFLATARDQKVINLPGMTNAIVADFEKTYNTENARTVEDALYSITLMVLILTNPQLTPEEIYDAFYEDCVAYETTRLDNMFAYMLQQNNKK